MELVVYYSRTNNTKEVSKIIADKKDAHLLEVKDKKSRNGPVGYALGAFDAIRGKKTNILYDNIDLSEYDTIYIGTPVWASKPAPAIMQFIEENNFSNKEVVTFATMSGSGGDSTVKIMNDAIETSGGNIKRSFSLAMKNNDIKQLVNDVLNDE